MFCGSPGESNKVILNISPGGRNEVPLYKNGYQLLLKEAGKVIYSFTQRKEGAEILQLFDHY